MAPASPILITCLLWVLAALSVFFVGARCYVRLFRMRSRLSISDYLVICGLIVVLAAAAIDTWIFHLNGLDASNSINNHDAPLDDSDPSFLLKITFTATFFYDIGPYFPKYSFIAFYYQWISVAFPRLRIALYVLTFYVGAAGLSALLTSLLWCNPISGNWTAEPTACHNIASLSYITVMWALNVSSDFFIFALPFFLLPSLKLQRRSFYAALVCFLLGGITMAASTVRYVAYGRLDDVGVIYLLFSIEYNTALIVTCLPSLKIFLNASWCVRRFKEVTSKLSNASSSDPEATRQGSSAPIVYSRRPSRLPAAMASLDDISFSDAGETSRTPANEEKVALDEKHPSEAINAVEEEHTLEEKHTVEEKLKSQERQ